MLTRTVLIAKGNDRGGDGSTTSSVGAVADTIAKVDILAETSGIGGGASKGWGQGQHVVDAGLLEEVSHCTSDQRVSCVADAIG